MTQERLDLGRLIEVLADQMETVSEDTETEETLPLATRLHVLDVVGRTCSRLASLMAQRERSEEVGSEDLSAALAQVLAEMRAEAEETEAEHGA